MSNASNDYIAIAFIAAGSSWARRPSKAAAIASLRRRVRQDWRDFVAKGTQINVTVVDATGIDEVIWDCDGFWNGDSNERLAARRVERKQITL
jgi:hypothetical protein